MISRTRRALFSAAIFLAACGVTGSIIGGRVAAQSATDESTLRDSMKNFTDVYALVEQNYADKLNTDQVDKAIYDGAIPGMLHVLDPHSNFYDPKAFAQMREGRSIRGGRLAVGDLVFWAHGGHVGIYTGRQRFISATVHRGIWTYSFSVWRRTQSYTGARRILG